MAARLLTPRRRCPKRQSLNVMSRRSIQPAAWTRSFGALPHPAVVDAVVTADVMIGCTDEQAAQQTCLKRSCASLSYPALDCGVALEGKNGSVTAQVIQCVRFLPDDPCPLCRQMIVPEHSRRNDGPRQRAQRRAAAADAVSRGDKGAPYWRDLPQLNTVGYLTTLAGAMAADYAIGWITGRFIPPFSRLQRICSHHFLMSRTWSSRPKKTAHADAHADGQTRAQRTTRLARRRTGKNGSEFLKLRMPNNEPRRHHYTPVLLLKSYSPTAMGFFTSVSRQKGHRYQAAPNAVGFETTSIPWKRRRR